MRLRGFPSPALRAALRTLLATLGVTALPAAADAAGPWQTILRARDFTDLLVTREVVWCATAEAGLLRFDRVTKTFESITREPGSIASNHVRTLSFDHVGRLWVGTDAGVSRLATDGATWELISGFDGLPDNRVTTITAVGETLWIGTEDGIALWDGERVLGSLPDGNTVSFDTTFEEPSITGVEQFADTVWLATPRGVGFGRTSTNLTDWRKANTGLASLRVDHLATDGRTLFAQAVSTLYRWNPLTTSWVAVAGLGAVHSLGTDYGVVLVASTLGIFEYQPGTDSFTLVTAVPASAPSDGDDPEPAIGPADLPVHYAGSSLGLWEEPATPGPWATYPTGGPPGNTYNNIVIDGARVYAATRSRGIGRWDGATWFNWLPGDCFDCPNAFRNPNEVFAMVVDRNHQKWVACWGYAIDRFDDSSDPATFTHFWDGGGTENPHTVGYGAAVDSSGGVWFGMDTYDSEVFDAIGLEHYLPDGTFGETWTPGLGTSKIRGAKIRAITVDRTGRIWVGYAKTVNSGVDHFVGDPDTVVTLPNSTEIDVWALVAHGDSIWMLTDTNLRRINRSSLSLSPQLYDTPPGRPLGMRLLDVAPNGDVWVGSENGVRRYRNGGGTEDFTVANSPLAANEVRAVAVDRATGAVWIGTADGLNRYDPGYRPPEPPAVAGDSLNVFPNPATLTGLGVELRLIGAVASYVGGIYDLRGRLLRRFVTTSRGHVFWDGRDEHGELVKPGVYFVLAEGGGRRARTRFVLLH